MNVLIAAVPSLFFCAVALSGYGTGRDRVSKRKNAYQFACHMSKEIKLFSSPISEIIKSFDGELTNRNPLEIANTLELMSPNSGAGSVCEKIMSSSAPEAQINCERLCVILSDALEKEINENNKSRGMRVIFPLFLAAVVFIVLI